MSFEHITNIRQRAFLIAYSELGCVTAAATAAKIGRRTHYLWRSAEGSDGDAYRAAMREAGRLYGQALLERVRRRTEAHRVLR